MSSTTHDGRDVGAADIARALGAKPSVTGNGWTARCICHEDTHPSLSISEGKNGRPLIHCHAGCSQESLVDELKDRGLWPTPEGVTVADLARAKALPEDLLRESGFADETFNGRPRIRITYEGRNGETICTRYRLTIDKGATGDARFRMKPGDKQQLYGLWRLKVGEPVILVEGETDCIALWAAGFNALGIPGANAWRDDRFAGELEHNPVVYVHVEPDKGGEEFRSKLSKSSLAARLRFFTVAPAAKDPCELRARDPAGFRSELEKLIAAAKPAVDSTVDPPPIALLALDLKAILDPIPPERYLIAGVPCEAYSLIAGALSSYKSTLLLYMLVLRATGYDFLNLDITGVRSNIGPAVLIFYEDTDRRVLARLHRILQAGHGHIRAIHGDRAAQDFLEMAVKNLRRISCTGEFQKTLVTRLDGNVVPNELMLEALVAQIRAFTTSDVLIGIDPLRLAIVGSQNDDDGADVVVHTLNRLSCAIPDAGLLIASHTTKAGAQDPGEGYAAKAYATSGSALYSQHARSNFHLTRIKAEEIARLFSATDVPASEHGRQPVAQLTHGRLSHGTESAERYFRMNDAGLLVPLEIRKPRSVAEIADSHLGLVVAVIDDIRSAGRKASEKALCADERLLGGIGGKHRVREILGLLEADGYIEFTGKTRDRNGAVTDKGRAILGRDESARMAETA